MKISGLLAIVLCFSFVGGCVNAERVKADKVTRNQASLPHDAASVEANMSLIIDAILVSKIMTRDSGKPLSREFIRNCVKEQTSVYVEFYCDDLLWPHYAGLLSGAPHYLYLIEDGASVENRALFKIENGRIVEASDNLTGLLTYDLISKWMNKRFSGMNFTVEDLRISAQSHYRTKLPKSPGDPIIILSGDHGEDRFSYKAIGKIRWSGKQFELVSH